MNERDATDGQKLCALVGAMLMRTSFQTALSKLNKPVHEDWERMAKELKHGALRQPPPFVYRRIGKTPAAGEIIDGIPSGA